MNNCPDKTRLALLCGGRSAEHEVSLQSARNVIAALDKSKYELILIGIDKTGRWYRCDPSAFLENCDDPDRIALKHGDEEVMALCGAGRRTMVRVGDGASLGRIDAALPILHGPFGEDGTVQGLLKLADIPCVGADIVGSAVGMDKDIMKRLLRDARIPVSDFCVMLKHEVEQIGFAALSARLGLPLFVKPANMGSSVGISMVNNSDEFDVALSEAFRYDTKIIIEECVNGREIECSVLGNDEVIASLPGEAIANQQKHAFYDYEAKYCDATGADIRIPAELPEKTIALVQELAIKTFKSLCCAGMGRVDMFVCDDGRIYVNEINTIPGFTNISMYPKLWEASGIPYAELLDRLIALAIEKHATSAKLQFSRA